MDAHYAIYEDHPESFLSYFNENHKRTPESELMDFFGHEPKPKQQTNQNSEKIPISFDIEMSDVESLSSASNVEKTPEIAIIIR